MLLCVSGLVQPRRYLSKPLSAATSGSYCKNILSLWKPEVCSQTKTLCFQKSCTFFSEAERTTDLVSELAAERLVLQAARVVQVVAVHLAGQDDAELHHLLHGDRGEGLHRDVIVQLRHKQESCSSVCVRRQCKRRFTRRLLTS